MAEAANLVVAHGDEAAAVSGMHERGDDINRHCRAAERPEKICPAVRDAQAARATDFFHVLENDADDFAETERDDGPDNRPANAAWNADQQSANRRRQSARRQRAKKKLRRTQTCSVRQIDS